MVTRALVLSAILAFGIVIVVFYLYYKDRLNEDQAILWLFVCSSIIVISIWQDLLVFLNTYIVGADRATDFVFAMYIAFLIVIGINYSVKNTELDRKTKILAQEVALLKILIEDVKESIKSVNSR